MAVPPEEAERRCRRALMEAWTGRETAAFRLPPSRLELRSGGCRDSWNLTGALIDLRLILHCRRRGARRRGGASGPGSLRYAARIATSVVALEPRRVRRARGSVDGPAATHRGSGRPQTDGRSACGSLAGGDGSVSQPLDGWVRAADHFWRPGKNRALWSRTCIPVPHHGLITAMNLVVDLLSGTLESVTDLTLFGGSNALAIESSPRHAGKLCKQARQT